MGRIKASLVLTQYPSIHCLSKQRFKTSKHQIVKLDQQIEDCVIQLSKIDSLDEKNIYNLICSFG